MQCYSQQYSEYSPQYSGIALQSAVQYRWIQQYSPQYSGGYCSTVLSTVVDTAVQSSVDKLKCEEVDKEAAVNSKEEVQSALKPLVGVETKLEDMRERGKGEP